jgi:hypothetical protein
VAAAAQKSDTGIPASADIEPESSSQESPTPIATAEGLAGLPAEPVRFDAGWADPYYRAYAQLPRYEQTINGILIGPDVVPGNGKCPPGSANYIDPETAQGTGVWFNPNYLPPDAFDGQDPRIAETTAVECDGKVVSYRVTYGLRAADDVKERLAEGESWFDIPTGGLVTVFRSSVRGPMAWSSIAAERWYAATIGDLPAAVGKPILDRGLGEGAVIIWNPETEVTTHVFTTNVSLDELFKIAEELQ